MEKMPEMQKVLNDISNMDVSFEKAVQQYLQAYEQHLVKRTTREVFRSTTSKLEKDINARTSELLAMLTKVYSKEGLDTE
jgi:predicted DNA binding CopG/RHH family protein